MKRPKPIVTDGHLDKTVAGSPSTHRQQALAVSYAGQSVHAVEQEIKQHLLEMNSVAAHRWQIAWHVNLDANVPCRTVGACEHYDFIHQFTQHQRARIELSPLEQCAQPIDDFTGTLAREDASCPSIVTRPACVSS